MRKAYNFCNIGRESPFAVLEMTTSGIGVNICYQMMDNSSEEAKCHSIAVRTLCGGVVVFGVALLSLRLRRPHFDKGETQKRLCTVHRVHIKESEVVKSNSKSPTTLCLIIVLCFWHVKPQKLIVMRSILWLGASGNVPLRFLRPSSFVSQKTPSAFWAWIGKYAMFCTLAATYLRAHDPPTPNVRQPPGADTHPPKAIEFYTINTRGKCGASVYSSCKQGRSARMRMMGSAWIWLNFVLLASNGFVAFCTHFKQCAVF